MAAARAEASPGPQRARIAIRLAWFGLADRATCAEALRVAVGDARAEPALLAEVHAVLANILFPMMDPAAAGEHASLAVELAEQAGEPALLALALCSATRIDFYAGRGLDRQRLERALALESSDRPPVRRRCGRGQAPLERARRGRRARAARRSYTEIAAEQRRRGDGEPRTHARSARDARRDPRWQLAACGGAPGRGARGRPCGRGRRSGGLESVWPCAPRSTARGERDCASSRNRGIASRRSCRRASDSTPVAQRTGTAQTSFHRAVQMRRGRTSMPPWSSPPQRSWAIRDSVRSTSTGSRRLSRPASSTGPSERPSS